MKILNPFTLTLRVAALIILFGSVYLAVSSHMSHASASAKVNTEVPTGKPEAMVDLGSVDGVKAVKGEWRYSDTKIIETDFRGPGPDKQPTGAPVKTYDYAPHAGGADFDDSKWEVINPTTLDQRRGNGRLAFNWYRIKLTIPDRIGDFDPTGSTAVFETSLDDYAEIWVDGELSRALGQSGGSVIAGWNAQNQLVVGRDVKPGQQIQLAIFGVNGPLSNPPTNFIYIRYARLAFYKTEPGPVSLVPSEVNVEVERNDPMLDEIVGLNPKVFKLAEGFKFTEGPVWVNKDGGYLLFSDPNANTIYKYTPNGNEDGGLEVFRKPSGYSGADVAEYGQPGSNGLTLDPQGRLTINQHGNHRVVRDENDGTQTVLADSYQGKRLNSPNDLVYRSDGTLFFTDPPFGFPKLFNDARKQLRFSGVYSIYKGKLQLVSKDFTGPNGIALSPDEKYLYVGNWPRSLTGQELRKEDEPVGEIGDRRKAILRYEVQPDGTLKNGKLFFDFTSAAGEDGLDGIKVDQKGNLYVSAPGGLWVISPAGKHLGTIVTPRHVHNMAWGDADGRTLYLCARSGLYRIRLNIAGVRPDTMNGPYAPATSASATLIDGLGTYRRKISTQSQLAQQFFDQGLRLTYGYHFPEAIASFQEAQRHDPEHPMIFWGLALTIGPNPNSRFLGFPDDPQGEGRKAIKAARERVDKASTVERALIEALYVLYDVDTYPTREERDVKFIEAARALHKRYPDDLEAGFLLADALMIHSQWSYWRRDGSPLPGTSEAAAALQRVLALNPKHPGAVHLYIHLFESSTRPERALPQANLLESLMPGVGHIVHMPSHIYIRLGQYDKAVASNERSLAADRRLLAAWGDKALPTIGTYALSHRTHGRHAWDFIRFAGVLQGNYARALTAARAAAAGQTHSGTGGAHRMQATIPLVQKVFGKWDEVLAVPAGPHGAPYLDGLSSYVRGSAFVGRGELERAQQELERLKAAAGDPAIKNTLAIANPVSSVLELALHGLEGEIALARGQHLDAVRAFASAVRVQDSLKYIEPPDWGQSMRLYLGKALLKAGRARDAEAVYREDLREFRNNGWALFGLWHSLSQQGRSKDARKVRAQFERAWKNADVRLQASTF